MVGAERVHDKMSGRNTTADLMRRDEHRRENLWGRGWVAFGVTAECI